MKDKRASKIFYDGTCEFCSAIASGLEKSGTSLDLVELQQADLPKGVTKTNAMTEIHAVDVEGNVHKNIDAVLLGISDLKGGRIIAKIARLPGLHFVLSQIYLVVARNRHNILGANSRLFWSKNLLAIGFIASVIPSWNLWLKDSYYPNLPVWDFIRWPDSISPALPIVIILLAIGVAVSKYSPKYIFILAGVIGLAILADQARLQPWVYQYTIMLLIIGLRPFSVSNNKTTLALLQTLFAFILFYSGLHKLNPGFTEGAFPWLFDAPLYSGNDLVTFLAALSAVSEAVIGVMLLSNAWRNYGVYAATAMHMLIVVSIAVVERNFDSVILPWNIVMVLLAWLLFYNSTNNIFEIFKSNYIAPIIVALFVILPIYGMFDRWDSHLSFSLYTGNVTQSEVLVNPKKLPVDLRQHLSRGTIFHWSLSELNVPSYPEPRAHKAAFEVVCEYDKNAVLIIQHMRPLNNQNRNPELIECR